MPEPRPSHKELTKKLRDAREMLSSSGYLAVDPIKLAKDFSQLSLISGEEQDDGLKAAFSEITAKEYRGKHPPDKAFERVVEDRDVLVFIWQSPYFRKRMYLKFCFQDSVQFDERSLYVFSLHEDQPERRKQR